jgi:peptidoglycan-associated lipoprotein
VVESNAKFATARKTQKVVVEGNTDERGGREYNLALGQKRAEAVKRSMTLLGVPEAQIEAISFGEEKPRSQGGGESAWAENRRADIQYR